ncbi:MAG: CsgG/HfaB family protein [Caulobacterales bacterium]
MRRLFLAMLGLVASGIVSGCAYLPSTAVMSKLPVIPSKTGIQSMLNALPPPDHPVAVAVYGFSDQTGQFKPSGVTQTLSRAVSQGGAAMLIRSLQEAGSRSWFTIVEREQLKDILNERQLIRDMRGQYLGERGVNPQALPALLFAGVLLEGGVVGYDSNTVTGGAGAALLGIGATAKYQQDTVTVYLRAVSVKTGEVLTSVTTSKTITSYAIDANVFRYVGATSILETEDGFTTNEPGMLALQQAIDKAVYSLIMEGVNLKLWSFADPATGWPALWRYNQERDGALTAQQVLDAERPSRPRRPAGTPSASPPPMPAAMAAIPRMGPATARSAPSSGAPAFAAAGAVSSRAAPVLRANDSNKPGPAAAPNSPARVPPARETTAAERVVAGMVGKPPAD